MRTPIRKTNLVLLAVAAVLLTSGGASHAQTPQLQEQAGTGCKVENVQTSVSPDNKQANVTATFKCTAANQLALTIPFEQTASGSECQQPTATPSTDPANGSASLDSSTSCKAGADGQVQGDMEFTTQDPTGQFAAVTVRSTASSQTSPGESTKVESRAIVSVPTAGIPARDMTVVCINGLIVVNGNVTRNKCR